MFPTGLRSETRDVSVAAGYCLIIADPHQVGAVVGVAAGLVPPHVAHLYEISAEDKVPSFDVDGSDILQPDSAPPMRNSGRTRVRMNRLTISSGQWVK